MEARYYWGDALSELRRVLIQSEDDMKKKLSTPKNTVETGIWIEQMTTLANTDAGAMPVNYGYGAATIRNGRVALPPGMTPSVMAPPATPQGGTDATGNTNTIDVVCRAVDQTKVSGDASANSETAFEIESQLKASPLFDSKATQLTGQIVPDDSTGTFTFGVTIMPSNPLHL
jgi:hypothetical protein